MLSVNRVEAAEASQASAEFTGDPGWGRGLDKIPVEGPIWSVSPGVQWLGRSDSV